LGQAGCSGADIEFAGDDIGNQARAEFLDEGDFPLNSFDVIIFFVR